MLILICISTYTMSPCRPFLNNLSGPNMEEHLQNTKYPFKCTCRPWTPGFFLFMRRNLSPTHNPTEDSESTSFHLRVFCLHCLLWRSSRTRAQSEDNQKQWHQSLNHRAKGVSSVQWVLMCLLRVCQSALMWVTRSVQSQSESFRCHNADRVALWRRSSFPRRYRWLHAGSHCVSADELLSLLLAVRWRVTLGEFAGIKVLFALRGIGVWVQVVPGAVKLWQSLPL